MKEKILAVGMLFLAALFWSTSGVLIKLVDWHPLAIAGWRSFVAGFAIFLLCYREVRVSFGRGEILAGLFMGLFCICFVASTKLTTAANAIVLQYAAPVYVAVLAPRVLGEPTRRRDWYFLGLTVFGIGLFFLDKVSTRGLAGIVLGVVGSFLWAGVALSVRKARERSTAWPLSLGNFAAAAFCLPFMFRGSPGAEGWVGVILLGVVSLGAGYAVFSYAIKRVTALESVLIPSVEPIINPIWVFLATGEVPGPWAVAGGVLVLGAVTLRGALTALEGRRRPSRALAGKPGELTPPV